jgi:hypothetical protein
VTASPVVEPSETGRAVAVARANGAQWVGGQRDGEAAAGPGGGRGRGLRTAVVGLLGLKNNLVRSCFKTQKI